jgi:tRNA 2-thiouridine synthesizing protein A
MPDVTPVLDLDLTGLRCPMPVMMISGEIAAVPAGAVIRAVTTDPGSLADIPAWARSTGHHVLQAERVGDEFVFLVRRGGQALST